MDRMYEEGGATPCGCAAPAALHYYTSVQLKMPSRVHRPGKCVCSREHLWRRSLTTEGLPLSAAGLVLLLRRFKKTPRPAGVRARKYAGEGGALEFAPRLLGPGGAEPVKSTQEQEELYGWAGQSPYTGQAGVDRAHSGTKF
eukprot:4411656-Prymnesium_polylepis.1